MFRCILILLVVFNCKGQADFKYKKNNYQRIFVKNERGVYISSNEFSNNAVKNLIIINKYLKENKIVSLPDINIVVAKEGIVLNDFNVLVFGNKTKVIMEPNDLISYGIIKVHGAKNVKIINPTLIGDRDKHLGKEGEWGHGISILGSQNIEILNYNIRNCWGDGIYIGILNKKSSKNIVLKSGFLDYNRRNGMSIVAGEQITINDVTICNTFGTLPMYGLDIEPNNEFSEINDVKINNIKTINNYEGGIAICLHKMRKANIKNVNISIENYSNSNSKKGLFLSQNLEDFIGLKGKINIKKIKFDSTQRPIAMRSQNNNSFLINIDSVLLNDTKQAKETFFKEVSRYNKFSNVSILYDEN